MGHAPGGAPLLGVALLLILALLAGCKDAAVGPERLGSIEGHVLDYDSSTALGGVSITTSPPTSALVTDAEGRFVLEDVEAGSYTINARHPDYQSNTVTVSVQDGRTTQATIFLEDDAADEDTTQTALAVDVVNWSTYTVGTDSAFVRVEWRVRNTGTADIAAYEVDFRIQTEAAQFIQQERGDSLRTNQTNVALFEKYTLDQEAQSVEVDDVWVADS